MKIPFSPPYIDYDVEKEVMDTLKSGWITTGPKVKLLEKEISREVGASDTICLNSASSGLLLALNWLGVQKGDEVIVPSYTYCATALPVLHLGATLVMVDSDDDFNIDIDDLRSKITTNTKVIIPVDVAGWPCNYEDIFSLINSDSIAEKFKPDNVVQQKFNRIVILADSAHAFGATYRDKKIGNVADLTVFSFHAVKNITTAEGGCICLNLPESFDDQKVYEHFKLLSLNGQTKDALTKTTSGNWRYDIVLQGFKANMPDICAAIGLAQIRKYRLHLEKRQEIFDRYNEAFKGLGNIKLPKSRDEIRTSSCHLYMIRFPDFDETIRNKMIEELNALGISVNVHFVPLPMLTLFREMGFYMEDFSTSYRNYSTEISLPIYPHLSDVQVEYVIAGFSEVCMKFFIKNQCI